MRTEKMDKLAEALFDGNLEFLYGVHGTNNLVLMNGSAGWKDGRYWARYITKDLDILEIEGSLEEIVEFLKKHSEEE